MSKANLVYSFSFTPGWLTTFKFNIVSVVFFLNTLFLLLPKYVISSQKPSHTGTFLNFECSFCPIGRVLILDFLAVIDAFVVSVWAASGRGANSSRSQKWCQPVMRAASLNVSHSCYCGQTSNTPSAPKLQHGHLLYWHTAGHREACRCAAVIYPHKRRFTTQLT